MAFWRQMESAFLSRSGLNSKKRFCPIASFLDTSNTVPSPIPDLVNQSTESTQKRPNMVRGVSFTLLILFTTFNANVLVFAAATSHHGATLRFFFFCKINILFTYGNWFSTSNTFWNKVQWRERDKSKQWGKGKSTGCKGYLVSPTVGDSLVQTADVHPQFSISQNEAEVQKFTFLTYS